MKKVEPDIRSPLHRKPEAAASSRNGQAPSFFDVFSLSGGARLLVKKLYWALKGDVGLPHLHFLKGNLWGKDSRCSHKWKFFVGTAGDLL